MRRAAVVLYALIVLSSCGRKAPRVSIPPATPVSTSVETGDTEEGIASFYAEPYHGRRTANGEVFDTYNAMTAAHKTLPFNTMVRVTNKTNGQSVDVRINDRGPFIQGRIIDLSRVAAQSIDMVRAGVVPVKVTILKEGNNARVPATPPAASGYTVQVGAFENRQSAEELQKKLRQKFSDVSIQTVNVVPAIYRVRVGNEPDMESAQRLASQLRKQSLNPFVVRMN